MSEKVQKPPYLPLPVEVARQLSTDFRKAVVIICAWDNIHHRLHTTTYGNEPLDKIHAARGGEICAKALGMDLLKSEVSEDFRTVDAARNAKLRELVPAIIHTLRSYQFGNSARGPAEDMADRLEALLKLGKTQPPEAA